MEQADVHRRLRAAFENRRCVSAWLGYGNVLLVGFGDDVLARPKPGERHASSPYELETNFASWRVDGEVSAGWSDSESGADTVELTTAVESLVGETVVAWQLVGARTLRVAFTGAKALIVEPWPCGDGVSDAWSVSAPDGLIVAVSNHGRIVVVQADVPVRDWFA